jgi:hypothetical protein
MPIRQMHSRPLLALRGVAVGVAVLGLLSGGICPCACCQADEAACEAAVGDSASSCCSPAVAGAESVDRAPDCCGSCSSESPAVAPGLHPESPAEHPCHCQLTARDHAAAVSPETTAAAEGALGVLPRSWEAITSQPLTKARLPLVTGGFPERPVRILYGVWRN